VPWGSELIITVLARTSSNLTASLLNPGVTFHTPSRAINKKISILENPWLGYEREEV
jgi:hypothetical protein